jgi:hypothetical protein
MTLQMVMIYLSAAGAIGVLAAFAAHNRKTGWKKTRPTFVDALSSFYMDLGLATDAHTPSAPVLRQTTTDEATDFSLQLLRLRTALGSSTTATKAVPVQVEATVAR